MAVSDNGRWQRKEPGWYELYAKGWIESDSETDNPQEVAILIKFVTIQYIYIYIAT